MKKNARLSLLLLGAAVMIMFIPIHPPVLM